MKITMTHQISGTRDGEHWPAPGETIDVDSDEAETLIADGLAEPAGKKAPADENAAVKPRGEKRHS